MFSYIEFLNKLNEDLLSDNNKLLEKYRGVSDSLNKSALEYCINKHKYAKIQYDDNKDGAATGERKIGIVAMGTSRAGNACIRVFQVKGDSRHDVDPKGTWKLLLLKRIKSFKIIDTKETWRTAPEGFNPNDDKGMSEVQLITKEWFDKKKKK